MKLRLGTVLQNNHAGGEVSISAILFFICIR